MKDSKGNVVPVEPVDVSEGDKTVTFKFEDAVDEEDLTGVWTVNGVEYSFTVIEQLQAILDAVQADPFNELKLLEALNDAGIKNVDENKLEEYRDAIVDAKVESLEDVQKAIDNANKSKAQQEAETEAVQAVVKAKNQVQLLAALQNNFERVNKDWIVGYETKIKEIDDLNKESNYEQFDDIQKAIDVVNEDGVAAAYDKAFKSLKTSDVNTAKNLAETYLQTFEELEENQVQPSEYVLDHLAVLEAIIKVNAATTNNSLKNALVALDNLENALVEKYEDNNQDFVNKFEDNLNLDTVVDSLLAKYREAIKETDVLEKNQRKDIQAIIDDVNGEELNKVLEDVTNFDSEKAEDSKYQADALKQLQLLAALSDDVKAEDINPDLIKDYIKEIAENEITSAKDIQDLIKEVNDSVDAQAAAEEFKKTYKAVLDLSTDSDSENYVKADDLADINAALDAFNKLDEGAKKQLREDNDGDVEDKLNNLQTVAQNRYLADINLIAGEGNMSEKLEVLGNPYYAQLSPNQKEEVAKLFILNNDKLDENNESGKDGYTDFTKFDDIEAALVASINQYKTLLNGVNSAKNVEGVKSAIETVAGLFDIVDPELNLLAISIFEGKPEAGYKTVAEFLPEF